MKLLEINLDGFGRLINRQYQFHPKVNVIYGRNEAGKTTLQQAIVALLYGFYNGQRALQNEKLLHERFRPWQGDVYAGNLKYKLDAGQTIMVQRNFAHEDVPTLLLDGVTGEDIASQYSRGKRGQIGFMEKQIGMTRQVFLTTACVQHGALRSLQANEANSISDAILRLLDSAVTETSAEIAIERLDKTLHEIGSDRSQKALLARARQRLESLYQNRALRLAAQKTIQIDLKKIEDVEFEMDDLTTHLQAMDRQIIEVRINLLQGRLKRWQENEQRKTKVADEIAKFSMVESFPAERKEEFFRLRDEYSQIEKHQSILSDEKNIIKARILALQEKTKSTRIPEQTWANAALEDFLVLRKGWQRTFDAIMNQENTRFDVDKKLKDAGLDDSDRDTLISLEWEVLEGYKERDAGLKKDEEQRDKFRSESTRFKELNVYRKRMLSFSTLITAVVLASVLVTFTPENRTFSTIILFGLSLVVLAVIGWLNTHWDNKGRKLNIRLLETEKKCIERREKLRDIIAQYGVKTIEELIERRLKYIELSAAEKSHIQLQGEMKKIEDSLQHWMAIVGSGHIAIETLVDAEKRLSESHQLWVDKSSQQQRLHEIESQQKKLGEKHQEMEQMLEENLQQAGIDEPVGEKAFQAFINGCQQREYWDTLRAQVQQAESLSHEILEGESTETVIAQIDQLKKDLARQPDILAGYLTLSKKKSENTLAGLRENRQKIQDEIHKNQKNLSVIKERIDTRMQDLPPLSEIEEDIAIEEADVSRLERARQALTIASDLISLTAKKMHHDFVPRLNGFLSRHLKTLTDGKYVDTLINPVDFRVRVIRQGQSAPIEIDRLSFGTREQIYLLLRAAVVDFFSHSGESVPLFFDDPLVHSDTQRVAGALKILNILSDAHQVFYFTKDEQIANGIRKEYGPEAIFELTSS